MKIIQNSNDLKLFNDVDADINVTSLAVTFEISDWTGTEFGVSWGGNIDFINDSATTWCGTDSFGDKSAYTIKGNGEYTLVCDLNSLCSSLGKEGIAHLQTCEMVISNVADGDTTQIEIKSARIYTDGETPEESVIPQPEENSSQTESNSDSSSYAGSESQSDTSSSTTDSSSTSKAESSSASTATKTGASTNKTTANASTSSVSDTTNSKTGTGTGIILAGIALTTALIVVSKKK